MLVIGVEVFACLEFDVGYRQVRVVGLGALHTVDFTTYHDAVAADAGPHD